MKNARVNEDGSMNVDLRDWYNFEKLKLRDHQKNENFNEWKENAKYNGITKINNNAYKQEQSEQLEPYMINVPLNISREELAELEEWLKKQKRKKR